ncbi:MAG: proprotein convertase P-domain-containing protein, partial [Anaerolineales bacterium]|nr:proprotein convertase P-domain-containing protein [Anaerolineales bacterium]
ALTGSDYAARAGTLTFGTSATALTFTVSITNEGVYEGNETLAVTLSAPVSATLGAAAAATLTLVEATAAPTLAIAGVSVAEGHTGTPAAVFAVTVTGPRALPVTANYATQNGTAQAGSDYTAAAGVLTFPVGVNQATVTVSIAGDRTYEADETFAVLLSNLGNAVGGALTGAGTILNDDPLPTVSFAPAAAVVGENAGAVVVTATLSNASAFSAAVDFTTREITAKVGADFTPTSGTLTFAAGVTSQAVTVPLVNDTGVEPNEILAVDLSGGVGVQLGAAASVTVTIANEDAQAGCAIFNSSGLPMAIPDNTPAGISSVLAIPSPGVVITEVNVRIDDLRHTWTSDLRLYLTAPNGHSVTLIGGNGVGGRATGDAFRYLVLDDAGLSFSSNPQPPITGSYHPFETLAPLQGLIAPGNWTLKVVDTVSGDTGSLNAWGLELCGTSIPVTGGPPYVTYLPMIRLRQ